MKPVVFISVELYMSQCWWCNAFSHFQRHCDCFCFNWYSSSAETSFSVVVEIGLHISLRGTTSTLCRESNSCIGSQLCWHVPYSSRRSLLVLLFYCLATVLYLLYYIIVRPQVVISYVILLLGHRLLSAMILFSGSWVVISYIILLSCHSSLLVLLFYCHATVLY